MGASIVHFGQDICYRLPVLRSAGFTVEACESLDRLPRLLSPETDAVTLDEALVALTGHAIALVRTHSSAPLILFREEPGLLSPNGVDLVIPSLTPPEDWLREIAALIERSRAIRAESRALVDSSLSLRQESAAVRAEARKIRERSVDQCSARLNDPSGMAGSNPD